MKKKYASTSGCKTKKFTAMPLSFTNTVHLTYSLTWFYKKIFQNYSDNLDYKTGGKSFHLSKGTPGGRGHQRARPFVESERPI
jgi:hypothetical protein